MNAPVAASFTASTVKEQPLPNGSITFPMTTHTTHPEAPREAGSRTQHTPTPWRSVPTTCHDDGDPTIRRDIVSDGTHFNPSFVAGDILPADARLIAAAPDLLAAATTVFYALEGTGQADLRPILSAAIARATEGRE